MAIAFFQGFIENKHPVCTPDAPEDATDNAFIRESKRFWGKNCEWSSDCLTVLIVKVNSPKSDAKLEPTFRIFVA